MRVERAEQAGQSTTWLQLTLEDGTRLKAPAFSVAELGAFAGKELTCEELAQLKAEAAKARTKERAVRTVAASAVSEKELQKRLVQKGSSEEDAEETYVITYNGKKLVASDFQSFYQECISLACSDYTVDKINAAPDMTFVFTYSDTSRAATSVEFKKASETKYQYSIDGIDMGKINSSALNKILKQVQKLTAEK